MCDEMRFRCFRLLWVPGMSLFKAGRTENSEGIFVKDSTLQKAADELTDGDVAKMIDNLTPESLLMINQQFDDGKNPMDFDDIASTLVSSTLFCKFLNFKHQKHNIHESILEDCFGNRKQAASYLNSTMPFERAAEIKAAYRKRNGGVSLETMLESLDGPAMEALMEDEVSEYINANTNIPVSLFRGVLPFHEPFCEYIPKQFQNEIIMMETSPGITTLFNETNASRSKILQVKTTFIESLDLSSSQQDLILFATKGDAVPVYILNDSIPTISQIAALAYQQAAMLAFKTFGFVHFQGELSSSQIHSILNQMR